MNESQLANRLVRLISRKRGGPRNRLFSAVFLLIVCVSLARSGGAAAAEVPYNARVAAALQAATDPEKAMNPEEMTEEEISSFEHMTQEGVFLNKFEARGDLGEYEAIFKVTLDQELDDPTKAGLTVLTGDGKEAMQLLTKSGAKNGKELRLVLARRKIGRAILTAIVIADANLPMEDVRKEVSGRLSSLIDAGKRYGMFGGLAVYWAPPQGDFQGLTGGALRRGIQTGSETSIRLLARYEDSDGNVDQAKSFKFILSGALADIARIEHKSIRNPEKNVWIVNNEDQPEVRLVLDATGEGGVGAVWHDRIGSGIGDALESGGLRIRIEGERK